MNEKVSGLNPTPTGKEGTEKIRMVPFIIEGKEHVLNRKLVMDALDVKDIVRMQRGDFPNLPAQDGVFAHFNFEVSVNKAGEKYAFMRIEESRQPEPLLNLDDTRVGECDDATDGVSYDEAEARGYFAMSLPGMRTREEVQAAMIKRYGPGTSRNLTVEEVKSAKLGVTVFRMAGLASQEKIAELVTPAADQ